MLFLNILENRIADLFVFRTSRAGGLMSASGRGTPRSPRYSKTVSELSMPVSNATGSRPLIVLDRTLSDSLNGSG